MSSFLINDLIALLNFYVSVIILSSFIFFQTCRYRLAVNWFFFIVWVPIHYDNLTFLVLRFLIFFLRSLLRKCFESALMANSSTVTLRQGFYNVSPFLAVLLLSQCRKFNNNDDGDKKKESNLIWRDYIPKTHKHLFF